MRQTVKDMAQDMDMSSGNWSHSYCMANYKCFLSFMINNTNSVSLRPLFGLKLINRQNITSFYSLFSYNKWWYYLLKVWCLPFPSLLYTNSFISFTKTVNIFIYHLVIYQNSRSLLTIGRHRYEFHSSLSIVHKFLLFFHYTKP